MSYLWMFDAVFWSYFIYYCMTFLVASVCSQWYYKTKNKSIMKSVKNIKYHLGSISLGALIITIISILQILVHARVKKYKIVQSL
jgi:hypothetical protein